MDKVIRRYSGPPCPDGGPRPTGTWLSVGFRLMFAADSGDSERIALAERGINIVRSSDYCPRRRPKRHRRIDR